MQSTGRVALLTARSFTAVMVLGCGSQTGIRHLHQQSRRARCMACKQQLCLGLGDTPSDR